MANEILVLEGDGEINVSLLFLFPILTPIQVNATNVIPTPASGLPALAQSILDAGEKSSLDAGTTVFEVVSMRVTSARTNLELLAQAQALYVDRNANYLSKYALRYKHSGKRLDA